MNVTIVTKIWCVAHTLSFWCEVHAKFSVSSHQIHCDIVNSHHNQYELILTLMLNYFVTLILILHINIIFQKEIGIVPISLIIEDQNLSQLSYLTHKYTTHKVDYNDNSIGFCLHINIINVW